MPKNNKKDKNNIESLLAKAGVVKLPVLKDLLIHSGDNPALILIGVDSAALSDAFTDFIRQYSPSGVKLVKIENRETAG